LNNVSNKDGNGIKATDIPIITNPMCQCRCHVHQQPSQSNKDMKLMRPKLLRTKLFCLVVTTFLLVMVGLCIAYLFVKVNHQYHHHHHQTIRPMSPLVHQPHQVNNRTLQDVFISVKTTKKYHYPRLIIQLETWASLVRSQTWFFTDSLDANLMARTDGHLIATNCTESHSRVSLACKMSAEFDTFLQSHKLWWCHFDDDNYVHVARLSQLLLSQRSDRPVYLGKPSTARPIDIWDLHNPKNVSQFWFATGGAGFCISRTMALKMAPYAANGKLVRTGEEFWFPDDVTIGYIIEHLLGQTLTVIPRFHSHLEALKTVDHLDEQISVSYTEDNVIDLPGPFSPQVDPTRFYSLHCHLYSGPFCPS